ncbi:MAG: hypothetical protein GXP31_03780 [Kiritimatiellaeota bacterium]|nr:hypothetical protein [Kiritimatiellota bacterium]
MRRIVDLTGNAWQLWRGPDPDTAPVWSESIPARVPGNVLDDLHRAGIVPDPYHSEFFRACAWVDEWTFRYRTTFAVEGPEPTEGGGPLSAVCLRFDGIDTFAEVFVNGHSVGTTHNMFRRHVFDVTSLVRFGQENELIVRVDPVVPNAHRWAKSVGVDPGKYRRAFFGFAERLYTRKAQMSFGWDQTPCLLAGGLYRPVYLEVRSGPVIEDVAWRVTDLDVECGTAVLEIQGVVVPAVAGRITVCGRSGQSTFQGAADIAPKDNGRWETAIPVENARFWWPNGAGEPHLYDVVVRFAARENDGVDERRLRIGLRTIEVVTGPPYRRKMPTETENEPKPSVPDTIDGAVSPNGVGRDGEEWCEVTPFVFKINGRRVFIKGFDWQAPDALFGRVTDHKTRSLLEVARDCHANMIRLWGGGTVESDTFYTTCSELGLLVWQDFFFACAIYPREPGFLAEIREEAEDIVRRLRSHTCVACWCGDNESDISEWRRGKRGNFDNPVNKQLLPGVLEALDPQRRYYHASSPSGGPHPMSMRSGDKRNWGAWDAHSNYRFIRRERARFISEGGCCSYPDIESIRMFLPEGLQLPLHNPTWRYHRGALDRQLRCFYPDERVEGLLAAFGGYESLEDAVEKSQFAQAWGMKFLAEVCRRQKYECGGVLLWKLTECWPCFDLGMIDYYGREKTVLSYIRDAFAPAAVSLTQDYRDDNADIEVFCVNDANKSLRGLLRIVAAQLGPGDRPLVEWREVASMAVDLGPDTVSRAYAFPCDGYPAETTVFLAALELAHPDLDPPASVGAYSRTPRAAYEFLRRFDFDIRKAAAAAPP